MEDRRRHPGAALFIAVVAFAIQQSAIVPAVETVQRDLHASTELSAWLVTLYLIVATVATPAMGRLGDLHGRRTMLLIGLGVFAVASVGAAFAPTIAVLIVCRGVQGVGGAVYPLALALGREHVRQGRGGGTAVLLTTGFGVGTLVGFVLGGVFAAFVSWRWIFVVGAVAVLVAFVLASRSLPREGGSAAGRFDLLGTVALSTATASLLVALTLAASLGWLSPLVLGLLALTVVAGVVWVVLERRTSDPLIELGVFRSRTLVVANLATIGTGWALFGTQLLVPRFVSAPSSSGYGLDQGPFIVGLLLLPIAAGQSLSSPIVGRLAERLPTRLLFAGGLVLMAVASGGLAFVRSSWLLVAVAALVLGLGAGTAIETSSSVASQGVDEQVAATSSALNSTVRRFAGGVGGQVGTLLLTAITVQQEPAFTAFRIAYLVAAALCLAGAGLLAVPGRHGQATS